MLHNGDNVMMSTTAILGKDLRINVTTAEIQDPC